MCDKNILLTLYSTKINNLNFKGTKGDWYCIETLSQMASDDTTVASLRDNYIFTTSDKAGDQKYDAILMSKSPEMLKLLMECWEIIPVDNSKGRILLDKIDNLIKQMDVFDSY